MKKKNKLIENLGLNIHPTVFGLSVLIILGFVTFTLLNLQQMGEIFKAIQSTITHKAGWFYILSVNVFLVFSMYLIFSRYGRMPCGP